MTFSIQFHEEPGESCEMNFSAKNLFFWVKLQTGMQSQISGPPDRKKPFTFPLSSDLITPMISLKNVQSHVVQKYLSENQGGLLARCVPLELLKESVFSC